MIILDKKLSLDELMHIKNKLYFTDMMKAVVDIEKGLLAVNAELHK